MSDKVGWLALALAILVLAIFSYLDGKRIERLERLVYEMRQSTD